ncbi:MAG: hypothetical protein CL908_11840 [Deltaproteobacteria bacterium]|nr:hypothetical protein [Deltaproteobacteria bacterium]
MRLRRDRRQPSLGAEGLNLTPMIDVVFNLIIFFMVITDLTQRDLEYLVLPTATHAETTKEDTDTLIVNVVDLDAESWRARVGTGEVSADLPPVFLRGRQMRSIQDLRARLRRFANPERYPDPSARPVVPGVFPSRKTLLIRCDRHQDFGWVQAIMQACTVMPGETIQQAIARSPLLVKVHIAAAEN